MQGIHCVIFGEKKTKQLIIKIPEEEISCKNKFCW